MFFKSRVLYTIESQRANSIKIYNDLENRGLISTFFSSQLPIRDSKLLLFLESLPSGTIFSKKIAIDEKDSTQNLISLPFFSSHIKIPAKPGEYIWVFSQTYDKVKNPFEISSYWLSRVHALNYTEDVNYTHNDRDFAVDLKKILDSKNTKPDSFSTRGKIDVKNLKKLAKNSIIKPENQVGNTTFELSDDEIDLINSFKSEYPNYCTPAVMSNADDLVFQGSNNTLLKLTTSDYSNGNYRKNKTGKGEVSIAAGIGSFANNTFSRIEGIFFDNQGKTSSNQSFEAFFPSHPSKSAKLKCEGLEENFKNPNIFSVFNDEIIPEGVNEGAFNILEDASKIVISELGGNESLFLQNYSTLLNISVAEDLSTETQITNSSLYDSEKKYKTFYYKKDRSIISAKTKNPTIDISSNNINLYSRKEGDGIKIIKEYHNKIFNKKLNAIMRINDKGDIFLDANRIFVGNGEYHQLKKELAEKTMPEKLGKDNKEYEGALVVLGESKNSQQLVLGNQLKEFLREMLDVNREDMHQTKLLFENTRDTIFSNNNNLIKELEASFVKLKKELETGNNKSQSFVSSFAPQTLPGAQVALSVNQLYSDITNVVNELKKSIKAFESKFKSTQDTFAKNIKNRNMKRDEELSLRLASIEDNIDKILSKISKTS